MDISHFNVHQPCMLLFNITNLAIMHILVGSGSKVKMLHFDTKLLSHASGYKVRGLCTVSTYHLPHTVDLNWPEGVLGMLHLHFILFLPSELVISVNKSEKVPEDALMAEACISFSTAFVIDFNINVKTTMPVNETIPYSGVCMHGCLGRWVSLGVEYCGKYSNVRNLIANYSISRKYYTLCHFEMKNSHDEVLLLNT